MKDKECEMTRVHAGFGAKQTLAPQKTGHNEEQLPRWELDSTLCPCCSGKAYAVRSHARPLAGQHGLLCGPKASACWHKVPMLFL